MKRRGIISLFITAAVTVSFMTNIIMGETGYVYGEEVSADCVENIHEPQTETGEENADPDNVSDNESEPDLSVSENTNEDTVPVIAGSGPSKDVLRDNPTSGDYEYSVDSNGNATIVKYSGSSSTLVIPESIEGNPVTKIGSNAFKSNTTLTSITFPSGLISIGSSAFYGCTGLSSPAFPAGLQEIGSSAFYGCTGITSLSFPEGFKSLGSSAFYGCTNLTSISYPASISSVSYSAFSNTGISSVTIAGTATTIPSYACYKMTGLASVTIPSGVTKIGSEAFYGCTSLSSITFPEGLQEIEGSAFYGCTGLTSLRIPVLNKIGSNVFYGCNSVQTVYFSYGIEELGTGICQNMSSLENIVFENGEGGEKPIIKTIGNNAFSGCVKLQSVTFPKSLTTLGSNAFCRCSELNNPNFADSSLTEIGSSCFQNCSKLTKADFPDTLTKIEGNAFKGCSDLSEVSLGSSLYSLGSGAFYGCAISGIKIPRNLSEVGGAPFENCANLKNITFENKIREIPDYLFRGCTAIETVTIPDTVFEIGNSAFKDCTGLQKVVFPTGPYSIGTYAFYGCSQLEEINLNNKISKLGTYAFANCTMLKTAALGEQLKEIPGYCFYNTALTEVMVPYTVASIGSYAFTNNENLSKVTISGFTKDINAYAFNQSSLTICSSSGSRAQEIATEKGYTFIEGTKTTKLTLSDTGTLKAPPEGNLYLSAEFEPYDSLDGIEWSSSNEEVATVGCYNGIPEKAEISCVSPGKATITVKMGSHSKSCVIEVVDALSEIYFDNVLYSITSLDQTLDLGSRIKRKPTTIENYSLSWSSDDESIAVVNSEGVVTGKKNGTTRIRVRDVKGYASTSCYVKVAAPIYPEKIYFGQDEIVISSIGQSRQLKLLTDPVGANEYSTTYSSLDESVATVTSLGRVSAVSEGETEIQAEVTFRNNKTYTTETLTAKCKVIVKSVNVPVTGIEISDRELYLPEVGSSYQLSASIKPENADIKDVIWYSNDTDVVKVDKTGKVTATGCGSTNVTAESKEGGFIATCEVTASKRIRSISFNKDTLLLDIGGTAELNATIRPSDISKPKISIYSTDKNVATIEGNVVTGISDGTAEIWCKALDGSGAYAVCKVYVGTARDKVKKPDDKGSEKVNGDYSAVLPGKQKIYINKYFTDKNIAVFKVDNKKIASVNKKGLLKGKKNGEVSVNGFVKNGKNLELKESHTFLVEVPKLMPMESDKIGELIDINNYITGMYALKPTKYELKKTNIGTVSENGVITVKEEGSSKVTVYFGDGKGAAKTSATLKVKAGKETAK